MWLATLNQARLERKVTDAADTSGDDFLKQALEHVTGRFEQETVRAFIPMRALVKYDAKGDHITSTKLRFRRDLLELVTLTNGDGASINVNSVVLDTPDLYPSPFWRLRIKQSAGVTFTYTTDWEQAIQVTGVWGYQSDYANAWRSSGDKVVTDNPLSASATLVNVQDADGPDALNNTPRFQVGQLLRIESEFMPVLAVDTANNRLTVARGFRGTTATTHALNTPIDIWQVQPDVNRAALRWVGYLYSRRGHYESVRVDGMSVVTFPQDVPEEAASTVDHYRRIDIRVLGDD